MMAWLIMACLAADYKPLSLPSCLSRGSDQRRDGSHHGVVVGRCGGHGADVSMERWLAQAPYWGETHVDGHLM